jgi:hypothetical protein
MKRKQKSQALPSNLPKPDLPMATLEISEAYFGLEEQMEIPVGHLSIIDHREAGKYLELNVREKCFTIRKDDIAWLVSRPCDFKQGISVHIQRCDEENKLYICVRAESDLFRKLTDARILKHGKLLSCMK